VQLSTNLFAVQSQALCPGGEGDGGGYSFMVARRPISNLIRENKTFRIDSSIDGRIRHAVLDEHLLRITGRDPHGRGSDWTRPEAPPRCRTRSTPSTR